MTEERIGLANEKGEIVLNDVLRYSDFTFSNLESMSSEVFPEQDASYVGTDVPLWYMTEEHHLKERELFKIVRWDKGAPNRVILVNQRLRMVIVSTPEHVMNDNKGEKDENGYPINNAYIHPYPIQRYDLLGIKTIDGYIKDFKTNTGMVIRADAGGEKVEVVIVEFLEGGATRFVTLEETKAVVQFTDIVEKTPNDFKKLWFDNGLGGI
jgi:hypothetical protein